MTPEDQLNFIISRIDRVEDNLSLAIKESAATLEQRVENLETETSALKEIKNKVIGVGTVLAFIAGGSGAIVEKSFSVAFKKEELTIEEANKGE